MAGDPGATIRRQSLFVSGLRGQSVQRSRLQNPRKGHIHTSNANGNSLPFHKAKCWIAMRDFNAKVARATIPEASSLGLAIFSFYVKRENWKCHELPKFKCFFFFFFFFIFSFFRYESLIIFYHCSLLRKSNQSV